jgi:acetolactate synthase-1/2/3 large subunit
VAPAGRGEAKGQSMKVYEAIADALAVESGGAVFGVMGDANMFALMTLAKDSRARLYSAKHEAAAVLMAEGFARATGGVGVASVTCGPGLSHTATSLLAAARGRVPLVVFTGQNPPSGRQQTQSLDHRRFAEACEALTQPVYGIDSLAENIREAFHLARTRSCPVVLNVPVQLMEADLPWEWEYTPSLAFLPRMAVRPAEPALEELADLLAQAERPIIIAGRGAVRSGAREAIRQLAEQAGALLATSLFAKGYFFGDAFDLGIAGGFASATGEQLMAEADVVLGIGASLNFYTTEGGFLFPAATVARIDSRPVPPALGVVPGLYIQGDAKGAAEALTGMLMERQVRKTGYRTPETLSILESDPDPYPPPTDGLDPRGLMRTLSSALPDDIQIICGVGHFWAFPILYLSLPPGGVMHFTSTFGSIGQALPVGMGMKAADPDRPTLVIEGDGSLLQSIQELQSVTESGLPLTILVLNDGGYGSEVHKLRQYGFDAGPAAWSSPDLAAVARAFGGDGVLLEDADSLPGAIKNGLAQERPFVIDARISRTTVSDVFRRLQLSDENRTPRLRPPA